MIIQLLMSFSLISLPMFFFGWDTFSWGGDIRALHYRGPLNRRLIEFDLFHETEWNGALILLYFVKYRLLRLGQIALGVLIVSYVYWAYEAAKYASSVKTPIWKLAFEDPSKLPSIFTWLMVTAALCWIMGLFVRITSSHVDVTMKGIVRETTRVRTEMG